MEESFWSGTTCRQAFPVRLDLSLQHSHTLFFSFLFFVHRRILRVNVRFVLAGGKYFNAGFFTSRFVTRVKVLPAQPSG